jgi:hypothetical protein
VFLSLHTSFEDVEQHDHDAAPTHIYHDSAPAPIDVATDPATIPDKVEHIYAWVTWPWRRRHVSRVIKCPILIPRYDRLFLQNSSHSGQYMQALMIINIQLLMLGKTVQKHKYMQNHKSSDPIFQTHSLPLLTPDTSSTITLIILHGFSRLPAACACTWQQATICMCPIVTEILQAAFVDLVSDDSPLIPSLPQLLTTAHVVCQVIHPSICRNVLARLHVVEGESLFFLVSDSANAEVCILIAKNIFAEVAVAIQVEEFDARRV